MRLGAILLVLGAAACDKPAAPPGPAAPAASAAQAAPANRLAPAVDVSDATTAQQLVSGFHEVEDGRWRWTRQEFVVHLGVPAGASGGARFRLNGFVAPSVIEHHKDVTVSCSVDGVPLDPETLTMRGPFTLVRDVAALRGSEATVSCRVDKVIPPTGADQRQLGIIVHKLALEPR